jgi:glycine oxidase
VVGAGPWGLATAWRAAGAGASVRVLDDGGRPAAHVAAGMLGPWSEATDGERDLHDLLVRAIRAWPAFARELEAASGADPGFRRSGAVAVAARPEHVPLVRRRLETLAAWGEPVAWATPSALRELEPGLGSAVAGGADLPGEHQVEPRALLRALRGACATAGVEIVQGRAAALRHGPVVVLEDGRTLSAGRVVLAAGWAAGRLSPRVPVRPVKGQILRLRAEPGAPLPIARTVRAPSVYLAPRDGEVVVGATMEERGDLRVTVDAVHELLHEALRIVPELGELELAEAAAGRRPATADGRPAIGPDEDGVVWAAGGYRHGLLLAPPAAEAAAAALAGSPLPDWAAALSPTRFPATVTACAPA